MQFIDGANNTRQTVRLTPENIYQIADLIRGMLSGQTFYVSVGMSEYVTHTHYSTRVRELELAGLAIQVFLDRYKRRPDFEFATGQEAPTFIFYDDQFVFSYQANSLLVSCRILIPKLGTGEFFMEFEGGNPLYNIRESLTAARAIDLRVTAVTRVGRIEVNPSDRVEDVLDRLKQDHLSLLARFAQEQTQR